MDATELANRFAYHPPKDDGVKEVHEDIREVCVAVALALNEYLPESREKSLALTAAQETMMWANASIAIHS